MGRIRPVRELLDRGIRMREIAELNAKINLLLAMNSLSNAEFFRSSEECAHLNEVLLQREEERAKLNQLLVQRDEHLATVNNELIRRGDELARANQELTQQHERSMLLKEELARKIEPLALKDREILDLNAQLVNHNKLLDDLRHVNETLLSSVSWRLTAPLRAVVNFIRRPS